MKAKLLISNILLSLFLAAILSAEDGHVSEIEVVSTAVPFPRGLVIGEDGELYALARGRVRGAGGVSAEVNDLAGTIFRINQELAEVYEPGMEISATIAGNGTIFAEPADPPFRLWDRASSPPERDRFTDRPYCVLRYDEATKSFYLCAFSGIDMPRKPGESSFSKNLTDALLRYDLRTGKWYEIERHDLSRGGSYPHHDIRYDEPPHGWLNGPNNCLVVGDWLYAVGKDNDRLVRYDLRNIQENPEAGPPDAYLVLEKQTPLQGGGSRELYGHSALAYRDGYLYVGTRTSSVIFRLKLDGNHLPVEPIRAEIVAYFEPYDPETLRSADITDIGFDEKGWLYVMSARPARVFRFWPDPENVFDVRGGGQEAWAHLAAITDNPKMKSENLLYHDGYLYVTSGDGYAYQEGADGTIYRVKVTD